MWHGDNVLSTNRRYPRHQNHLHHYNNNAGNRFVDVGHHQNRIYYPFSYVMVNDEEEFQEQENHHHYTFPQMLMSHSPPLPTPEPSYLPSMMLSSPHLPDSYYVHQPFTTMMQQPQQPSQLSTAPESSVTVGCNIFQQQLRPHINYYKYNERNSEAAATRIINNDSPSSCFNRIAEKTSDPSMKSTVIFNNNPQQQRTSNGDNRISEQSNEMKTQFETTLNDFKVVDVCKRTILAAMNKIMLDNYRSALYKLRKTIRVLEVLIFTEDCSGIGTTKTIYVRPWLETLKDMERKITQIQEQHNNDDHSLENIAITMADDTYHNQVRQLSCRNSSSRNDCINNEGGGRLYNFWWKSNLRRYRTTGELIVKHHRRNTKLRRYRRNK